MAYTTPSTYPVGTLIGTTEWDRDVVDNIIMLAEGPWTVRTGGLQAVPTGTWTKATFDTLVDGSTQAGLTITYSTDTDLFTFPVTGRYDVVVSLTFDGSTTSTAGDFRAFNIATSTATGAGGTIADANFGAPPSTNEELGACLAAQAIITSTTQHISARAFQDTGQNLNIRANSTAMSKRISLRWVGKV